MIWFFARVLLAVATLGMVANSFSCASRVSRQTTSIHSLPSAEESARIFSEYMVKSHTEKMNAIKALEEEKQAEIDKLKVELNDLKKGKISLTAETKEPSPTEDTTTTNVEALQQKLTLYQNFITKYVVESQEAKYNAVREAEAAVAAKYEAKISSMLKNPVEATTKSEAHEDKNGKIIDSEIKKLAKELEASSSVVKPKEEEAPSVKKEEVVVEAEKKVAPKEKPLKGSKPTTTATTKKVDKKKPTKKKKPKGPIFPPYERKLNQEAVYLVRNSYIAKAGPHSRWGPKEVAKSAKYAASKKSG